MKFSTQSKIAATVAVGVLGLGVGVPAFADDGDSRVAVDDVVPAFSRQQVAGDAVPASVNLDDLGSLKKDTVRKIGSDDFGDYWVARSGSSDVCMIVRSAGESPVTASSCLPLTTFYKTGISLSAGQSESDGSRPEAYLLPDDVDMGQVRGVSSRTARTQSSVGNSEQANLVVVPHEDSSSLSDTSIKRDGKADFNFRTLSSAGGAGK